MDSSTGTRLLLSLVVSEQELLKRCLVKLDGSVDVSADLDHVAWEFIKLGNMYAQGTNQPTAFH